jgi:signal transduction histidine kinase/CheY-like chemotaxis protein
VWLYTEDPNVLRCFDLYERVSQCHTQGAELSATDYPDYFHALAMRRPIIADKAHTHPATHEFSQDHFTPLGISSLLGIPIVIGGITVGILSFAHVGEPRRWQVEDQTLAGSAASLCSLALESHERTRAESALRQAKEEAEVSRREADGANTAKSEFLSRMSHELRTPLNSILGFGQILDKVELDPLSKESVGYILRGGRHLLDLINEVLDIARVESGHIDLSLEAVPLDDIVPEACALVRPLASGRGILLEFDITEPGRCHVLADHQRLKQVILNLLSNAIKYNRANGQVFVTCRSMPDERIRIDVRDTGLGIAPEDIARLFIPFERLNAANSGVEGTGLGLALSQRIVVAMGGTLGVESVPGQGSIFSIELPLATAPDELLEKSISDGAYAGDNESGEGQCLVLYIEDNLSNLRLLEVVLAKRPEVRLLSAMQGSVGLDLARQHEPDLILLDLNLPDMHGTEVFARLQQSALTRDIPVVIISADATPKQVERLLMTGAKDYLTKPLDIGQFLYTMDKFLQTTAGAE